MFVFKSTGKAGKIQEKQKEEDRCKMRRETYLFVAGNTVNLTPKVTKNRGKGTEKKPRLRSVRRGTE